MRPYNRRFTFFSGLFFLFLLLLVKPGENQTSDDDDDDTVTMKVSDFLKMVKEAFEQVLDDDSEAALERIREKKKIQPNIPDEVPFPCNFTRARSPSPPTDVNHIRPGDIDIIAALGDSLTTANGAAATNMFLVSREHRGLSWSIGGMGTWKKFLTLPNILKVFNPNLVGFSEVHSEPQFNGAELGTTVNDMPFLTKALVKNMISDPRVDVENHWKLVTILIGANDFCSNFCYMADETFENSYLRTQRFLTAALDHLRDYLPRTIVNIVPPPVLTSLNIFENHTRYCHSMHAVECPCLFSKMRSRSLEDNARMQRKWQMTQKQVSEDPRYRRNDFLVVFQPFTLGYTVPLIEINDTAQPDMSMLTEDCFHYSQKGHAAAAQSLWNNMLEPIGQKSVTMVPPFDRFLCPTEEYPYLFSYANSPNTTVQLMELHFPLT